MDTEFQEALKTLFRAAFQTCGANEMVTRVEIVWNQNQNPECVEVYKNNDDAPFCVVPVRV